MKKWLIIPSIIFFILACNLIGPYNVFQDMNASQIIEDNN